MSSSMRMSASLIGALLMVTLAGPATAQEDVETKSYATDLSVDYRYGKGRFVGAVGSGFGGTADEGDCVEDRRVTVFFKRRDGSRKKIGTTTTREDGRWSLRSGVRRGTYIAAVARDEFVYVPSYGELERAVCEPASARLQSSRDKVLGVRIGRGSQGGKLPFTGRPTDPFIALGLGLIGIGAVLQLPWKRRRVGRSV